MHEPSGHQPPKLQAQASSSRQHLHVIFYIYASTQVFLFVFGYIAPSFVCLCIVHMHATSTHMSIHAYKPHIVYACVYEHVYAYRPCCIHVVYTQCIQSSYRHEHAHDAVAESHIYMYIQGSGQSGCEFLTVRVQPFGLRYLHRSVRPRVRKACIWKHRTRSKCPKP